MTLQEQASQSGLVLLNNSAEWNENDWPPLKGGSRYDHASVVLDHTVVVLGGYQQGQGVLNSVFLLNLAEPSKQWREGPPLIKKRDEHSAVVCNGGIYVMGGRNLLNCIERIDVHDLLQSSLTTSTKHASSWKTLNCRLSTERRRCCAVAVENRYIVVMGGRKSKRGQDLSSVDIMDTRNHTVNAGPCMKVPRCDCAGTVIGHRIFVVGGGNIDDGLLDSVEYLEFASACDNQETKAETVAKVISSWSTWTTHSYLRLSDPGRVCAVGVGSCLVVAGGRYDGTVEILDTNRNCVWNLPPFRNDREGCSMVTVANQVAVIGGWGNSSCATLPLMDKNSWCFRRLCEPQPNGWYHSLEGMGNRDTDISSFSTAAT